MVCVQDKPVRNQNPISDTSGVKRVVERSCSHRMAPSAQQRAWDARDVSCCLAIAQRFGNCGTSPTTPGQGFGVLCGREKGVRLNPGPETFPGKEYKEQRLLLNPSILILVTHFLAFAPNSFLFFLPKLSKPCSRLTAEMRDTTLHRIPKKTHFVAMLPCCVLMHNQPSQGTARQVQPAAQHNSLWGHPQPHTIMAVDLSHPGHPSLSTNLTVLRY